MNKPPLRVALFACAYNEIDGVANTCHRFEEYALGRGLPFLNIHGGAGRYATREGSLVRCEFQRRWPKFALDKKHDFDLFFWRNYRAVEAAVREFKPDVLHITGPSDVGQLGTLLAHRLGIPLVASWHTNVHEYAEQRFMSTVKLLPERARRALGERIRDLTFQLTARFYGIARLLFAPNPELISSLERATGKPCHLMSRGVDTRLFHPERRDSRGAPFTIGYVGRFTTEKNIRFLAELESRLHARGHRDFRLLVVGQGAEESWLRAHLRRAEFPGVLQGEALARAYANMDVFVFPSRTDTFGNVVLEAFASGVPAVVTGGGGPKFIVHHGEDGFVAAHDEEFIDYTASLLTDGDRLARMRSAAREHALQASWDAVFERVYFAYSQMLAEPRPAIRWNPGLLHA
jgi:glycosyltransferase involved in cell wall biosynthesis